MIQGSLSIPTCFISSAFCRARSHPQRFRGAGRGHRWGHSSSDHPTHGVLLYAWDGPRDTKHSGPLNRRWSPDYSSPRLVPRAPDRPFHPGGP